MSAMTYRKPTRGIRTQSRNDLGAKTYTRLTSAVLVLLKTHDAKYPEVQNRLLEGLLPKDLITLFPWGVENPACSFKPHASLPRSHS